MSGTTELEISCRWFHAQAWHDSSRTMGISTLPSERGPTSMAQPPVLLWHCLKQDILREDWDEVVFCQFGRWRPENLKKYKMKKKLPEYKFWGLHVLSLPLSEYIKMAASESWFLPTVFQALGEAWSPPVLSSKLHKTALHGRCHDYPSLQVKHCSSKTQWQVEGQGWKSRSVFLPALCSSYQWHVPKLRDKGNTLGCSKGKEKKKGAQSIIAMGLSCYWK